MSDLTRRQALAASALGLALPAQAQSNWPERPVRLVVAFSAGGEPDILARAMQPSRCRRLWASPW